MSVHPGECYDPELVKETTVEFSQHMPYLMTIYKVSVLI
jgi:hypothetical protein